jgi:hypothetical protein
LAGASVSRGMDVVALVRFLNRMRQRKALPDYVLIGGVAAIRYGPPRTTKDVDIVVLVDDLLREFPPIWTGIFRRAGGIAREHTIFVPEANAWLDVMGTGGDSFYEDTLRTAKRVRIKGVTVKVARPEHLMLMSLRAWRPDPDYSRISALYKKADKGLLKSLLERFDDDKGTLQTRLAWITKAPD